VAGWFSRDTSRFRGCAVEKVRGGSVPVQRGAGRGWRCIGRSMSCVNVSWAELDGVQVHGNERHALRALACLLASGWHGRAALHGRFRAGLARGIDPVGRGGSGSEVIARAVVGGVLSTLGCPRWPR
jgi:hypothetical protein